MVESPHHTSCICGMSLGDLSLSHEVLSSSTNLPDQVINHGFWLKMGEFRDVVQPCAKRIMDICLSRLSDVYKYNLSLNIYASGDSKGLFCLKFSSVNPVHTCSVGLIFM